MQAIVLLWLGSAIWLNCAGWMLSALHMLTPGGWGGALLAGALPAWFYLKKHPSQFSSKKWRRRFHRPLPAVFLGTVCMVFLGGILYAPTNYDALTYRLPRLLNWLMAGHWFWIPTPNERMNCAYTGWEWMAMPILTLTRSDRLLFLINWSGFCLMPGLLFFIFRRLGVGGRVAWTWMWVLPLAYGYATQAGSIGNDLTGTIFCLLSVAFGLRARRTGCMSDVWLAVLAAAVMTGVKISNAPLVLPGLVALWPALKHWRERWGGSLLMAGVALVISAAPIMVLNHVYTGSWTGDPADKANMQVKNPVAALFGNSVLVAEQACMPPVLPPARKIQVIHHRMSAAWSGLLQREYPRFRLATLNELPSEEGAGLDLGLTLLILSGLAGTLWLGISQGINFRFRPHWVVAAGWVAGLVYMLKIGSEAAPRLMLPYYPLLLVPFLLLPGQAWFLRLRFGRICAVLAALSVLPVLILSPLRPLWPGRTVCEKLVAAYPGQLVFQRMASVYSTYAHRNDLLAPLRTALPDNAASIGLVAGSNDTDYSLWRPFGRRQVVYLGADPQGFLAHTERVEWLVVKDQEWPAMSHEPLAEWAPAHHFEIVLATNICELVSWGGEKWSLLHREK